MRLTTIGSGTAAPSPQRVQSGHLIEAGDVRLLLDCGSGVVFRMAQLGLAWQDITHVAITHFHPDHITDLANLLQAWRYGQLPPRSAPVQIVGPPGIEGLLERVGALFGEGLLEPGYPLSIAALPDGELLALGDSITIGARKVPHTDESVAYSIVRGARRLVYSGDTGFDPTQGEWAAGCDVLLCECSLPESMAMDTHLTPTECGTLAAIASTRLLALTHFYPPVERTDILGTVAASFSGPVALTHDGWSTDIEDE